MPNKQYDKLVRGKDDDMNDVMYGNAIPARAPFKKWRKKIPLKWLSTQYLLYLRNEETVANVLL
jgi:hypothetical protein